MNRKFARFKSIAILLAGVFATPATSANAALVLTLNGNGVYDTDVNITWLRDANLAASNTFGVSGIGVNGIMKWNQAQSWIGAINDANYLGFNDWRLPTVADSGTPGCNWGYNGTDCGYNTATGEVAHLYDELGNLSPYDTAGYGRTPVWGRTGPFTNVQSDSSYWYGTEYAPSPSAVWTFQMVSGRQFPLFKDDIMYAWAVRDGGNPVTAVSEPETYAMLLAGLGLMGFAGRRRKACGNA